MQAVTKDAKHLEGDVQKAVETIPEGVNVGPTIEEHELAGWTFVDSRTKHGFTHLYFTRLQD